MSVCTYRNYMFSDVIKPWPELLDDCCRFYTIEWNSMRVSTILDICEYGEYQVAGDNCDINYRKAQCGKNVTAFIYDGG